jgi:hypothetical protein
MYSYLFEEFSIESQKIDFNNLHLWIIHSDKTPPHIGISQNSKFFSLKATGKDNGLSTSDTFSFLKKRNIEFILVELNSSVIKKDIDVVYKLYSKAIPAQVSCITPILDCFNLAEQFLLFDLIKYLNFKGCIYSVNVYNFQREKLGIGIYGEKEIVLEIEKLQGVKRI